MIVAQAMVEGTPLLTADKALRRYGVELLKV
jgi:PIN domain nuclease of toxin-antitoxin system